MKELIRLENLCFSYNELPALKNINLSVYEGECLVLMGNNGSGKSTLLKLLNGLIKPDSGKYYFNNEEVNDKYLKDNIKLKNFHQRIGYIFQDASAQLFCRNVNEEVAFGPSQMGLDEEEVNKRVTAVLKLLEIEHLKDRTPYELSGGEKRKVTIAAILSMNPDVLVLDEPIASLDKKSQEWLSDFLLELKKTNKTMIIATHDEKLADKLADRIFYISDEHELIVE